MDEMDDWTYTWEVTNAILKWWEDAQYWTDHTDRNRFDEEPKFVTLAKMCKGGGVWRE